MSALHWGTVTRVAGAVVHVSVPTLARGYELGPVTVARSPWTDTVDGDPAHGHAPALDLAVGDAVLVGVVGVGVNDLVILGRR